ncbi:MAG: DUF1573 domain-containing protein [Planctomycetes bacterium]|nr:DUF1573 domain-containing protein [Planctomycetota bacterium]
MLRTLTFSLVFASWFVLPASAQEWAEKMFNKVEHDFGTVARGSDTVYKFEVTNLYKQTMKITRVRTSCGCTSPTVENGTIKTYEKAYIVAKFNTRTYTGRHGATLTISFAPPYSAEVQVRVHGNIRRDVVFSPGAIAFSNVDEGEIREQTVTVSYAGRANWSIVDVTNDNDHFEVELSEISRSRGKVSYRLLVRLKDDVPAGYFKDQLTVVTNDQRAESQRHDRAAEDRHVDDSRSVRRARAQFLAGEGEDGREHDRIHQADREQGVTGQRPAGDGADDDQQNRAGGIEGEDLARREHAQNHRSDEPAHHRAAPIQADHPADDAFGLTEDALQSEVVDDDRTDRDFGPDIEENA